jgi:hypothetical protein
MGILTAAEGVNFPNRWAFDLLCTKNLPTLQLPTPLLSAWPFFVDTPPRIVDIRVALRSSED